MKQYWLCDRFPATIMRRDFIGLAAVSSSLFIHEVPSFLQLNSQEVPLTLPGGSKNCKCKLEVSTPKVRFQQNRSNSLSPDVQWV